MAKMSDIIKIEDIFQCGFTIKWIQPNGQREYTIESLVNKHYNDQVFDHAVGYNNNGYSSELIEWLTDVHGQNLIVVIWKIYEEMLKWNERK